MRIMRTFDPKIVRSVMCHPAIWETVAEDDQIPETFIPEMVADCWLQIVSDGTLLGLYNVHPHSSVTLEVHAQLLTEHRKEHSNASIYALYEWLLENCQSYQKLIAIVPFLYPNVKDFCLSAGMQIEGVNRLSYRKNGRIWDQWNIGITFEEMKAFLGERQ